MLQRCLCFVLLFQYFVGISAKKIEELEGYKYHELDSKEHNTDPRRKIAEFALSVHEIPQVISERQTDPRCPQRCHLDPECYDYYDSVFHPAGCKSRVFNKTSGMECLLKRPIVTMGDSRTYELYAGLQDYADLIRTRCDVKHKDKSKGKDHNEVLLMDRFTGKPLLQYIATNALLGKQGWPDWNKMFTDNKDFSSDSFDGLTFLIGSVAPHVIGFQENYEDAFKRILPMHLRALSANLERAKIWITLKKISNVVYFKDAFPQRLQFESNYKLTALKKFEEKVSEVLKKYPFVKIWDSHRPAAEEHRHICEKFVMPTEDSFASFKKFALDGVSGANRLFKCPDTWHHGRIYALGVAQMLLNYICPEDN